MKIKLSLSLILILSLTGYKSIAQKGFAMGVVGGPQITAIINSFQNTKSTKHFNAGIAGSYNFTGRKGIRFEILYSEQGSRNSIYFSSVNATNTGFDYIGNESQYKLNFIKIPLFFAYKSNTEKRFAFVFNIGPEFCYLTHATYLFNYNGTKHKSDLTSSFNRLNLALAINFGLSFKIKEKIQVFARVHYDHDLFSVYKTGFSNAYNISTGLDFGINYAF